MTIEELIEELKKYDPKKMVTVNGEEIQFISDYSDYHTNSKYVDIISDYIDDEDVKPYKLPKIKPISEKIVDLFR